MRQRISAMSKTAAAFCLAVLLLQLTGLTQAFSQEKKPQALALTLNECIARALANNLDLSLEAFNPEIQDASISVAKERYLPEFSLGYFNQKQTIQSPWGLEGTSYLSKFDRYYVSLTQRVVTGGSATLSFSNSMTDQTRAFTQINPAYNSTIQLNLSQPLLKNFGPKVNRTEMIQAVHQKDMSMAGLKSRLIETVYSVEEAYWNLYSAVENLSVQESSLDQSREILKRNQEAARIGTKSAIELLASEAEVAAYEDSLVLARQQAEQAESRLRSLLNLPAEAPISGLTLSPSEKPVIEKKEITYEEALKVALAQRPEMAQADTKLEIEADNISFYKNQLLPQLDLSLSAWSPGQSGIKSLYLDDNPLTGIVVGKVEGSRLDSMKEALKRTYKNWSVNLTLSVPLANVFSRANLAKAKIQREQSLVQLEKQKQAIAYEVAEAIKLLLSSERKIKTSAANRELQEKRLEAEIQRYQLGLVGSEWLFTYQRQLTTAKTSEIRALIDYQIAVANLERIMGTSLRNKGIRFRDYEF